MAQSWTNPVVAGNYVRLSPSKVYLMDQLLPSAIAVHGEDIIVSPIKMYLKIGSGSVQEVGGSGSAWFEAERSIVRTWEWEGDSIDVFAVQAIYDDGLIATQMIFTPGASQRMSMLYMQHFFRAGLTKYLLRYPRLTAEGAGGVGPAAQEFDGPEGEGFWSTTTIDNGNSGLYRPRSLIVHDRKFGFQWACDSDENWGHSVWGSQSNFIMAVDQQTDSMAIHFIDGLTPASNSSAAFTINFYLYPLPAGSPFVPRPWRINRGSGNTARCADLDLRATEGVDTEYEWMGSAVGRDTGSASDWDTLKAGSDALEIGSAAYALVNCYPSGDDTLPWNSGYKVAAEVLSANSGFQNPPHTQYKQNGSGDNYSLEPTDLSNTDFFNAVITRSREAAETLGLSAIYYDVAQTRPQRHPTDAWGRASYIYPHTLLRDVMRYIADWYWENNLLVIQHQQCDMLPLVHTPSSDIWVPGEEMRVEIEDLGGDLPARKRYYSDLSEYRKRAEWCPKLWGHNGTLLPQLQYNATPSLTDYGASGGSKEYFATEIALGEALLEGLGFVHSFSDVSVTKPVYEVLRDLELENAVAFEPQDSDDYLASSTDSDARIAGWKFEDGGLVLVIVNRSDSAKTIPFTLRNEIINTTGEIAYASTGISSAEGRDTAYASVLTGDETQWSVSVVQRCFVIVTISGTPAMAAGAATANVRRYTDGDSPIRRFS